MKWKLLYIYIYIIRLYKGVWVFTILRFRSIGVLVVPTKYQLFHGVGRLRFGFRVSGCDIISYWL